ncbi:class A beta-lactamase [uncultured Alistipes sp.]|uniref:class A beta-lactamase n=1 Tax=uncultured Alistipes sp. TaxID=538949 RepID=UPI002599E453|nr:class A beta-lactamase [uncultured Alistipes sp.]
MFRRLLLWFGCWAMAGCSPQAARRAALERELLRLTDSVQAQVGIAAVLGEGDTLTINNKPGYPMASVFKFHQALALLDSLDRARLTPDFPLSVRSSDLLPDTWSPLRDARPEGGYSLSVAELLAYSIAHSDNNVCDLLFRFLGGPETVGRYIHGLGLSDTAVAADEETMHRDPATQYANTTSPLDAVRLLERFRRGELLRPSSTDLLMHTMLSTATGPDKLKGLLPAGTPVAHKTGSGLRDAQGTVAADNDIGIIFLPDGRTCSIAVLITDSAEADSTNAHTIALISKNIYNYLASEETIK